MTDAQPVLIDVVSDVVCPWCFVGAKHLEQALASVSGAPIVVRWRPYQLDPTIPDGGVDRKAYMQKKFGDGPQLKEAHQRLEALGSNAGIEFDFDAIQISPNTLDAHRLIRWAFEAGVQDMIVKALFSAYFERGIDIGDKNVLADIAGACGMNREIIRAKLDSTDDFDAVRTEISEAQRIGISGVPFFIMNGKVGVSGAHPPQTLLDALKQSLGQADA